MNKIYLNRSRNMVKKIIMTDKNGAVSFVELTPLQKVTLNIPDGVKVELQKDIVERPVVVPKQVTQQQQKKETVVKSEVKDGNV